MPHSSCGARAESHATKPSVFVQAIAALRKSLHRNLPLGNALGLRLPFGHLGVTMTDSAISRLPVEQFAARRRNVRHNRAVVVSTPRLREHINSRFDQYRRSPLANIVPLSVGLAVVGVLWIGWHNRDDSGLTPESGVGYWLGIAGSALMLLLLLYPLRKRMSSLRTIGTVAFWFRAHMILGLLGCVLVLWHANFKLGSINSNVALFAMLVVAASGIVGRYLYSKIHRGLYGRKAVVQEILADADALKDFIGFDLPVADRVAAQLKAFAQLGTAAPKGILGGLLLLPGINWRGSAVRRRLITDVHGVIAVEAKRLGWSRRVRRQQLSGATDLVTLYVVAVKKAAAFAFYERLFRIWHIFHMPLFFLLVVAAIVHVFAAHFF
jgi:hypothetical protein